MCVLTHCAKGIVNYLPVAHEQEEKVAEAKTRVEESCTKLKSDLENRLKQWVTRMAISEERARDAESEAHALRTQVGS